MRLCGLLGLSYADSNLLVRLQVSLLCMDMFEPCHKLIHLWKLVLLAVQILRGNILSAAESIYD